MQRHYETPWPQSYTSPSTTLRKRWKVSPLRTVPQEILFLVWDYVPNELEDAIAIYNTCKAWRERSYERYGSLWEKYNTYASEWKELSVGRDEKIATLTPLEIRRYFHKQSDRMLRYGRSVIFTMEMLTNHFVLLELLRCSKHRKYYDTVPLMNAHLKLCGMNSISDRPFAFQLVQIDGNNLSYLCEALLDDDDIVMAAIRNCGDCIIHASERILRNKSIAIEAVKRSGLALQYINPELLEECREIVDKAVAKCGSALSFSPPKWKNDFHIAMRAVKQCGLSLRYVDDVTLHENKELVIAALKGSNGKAYRYIHPSSKLVHDYDVADVAMVASKGASYVFLSHELKHDPKFAKMYLCAGKHMISELESVPSELLISVPFWDDVLEHVKYPRTLMSPFIHHCEHLFGDLAPVILARYAKRFPAYFYPNMTTAVQKLFLNSCEARQEFVATVLGMSNPSDVHEDDEDLMLSFLDASAPECANSYIFFTSYEALFLDQPLQAVGVVCRNTLAIVAMDKYIVKCNRTSTKEREEMWYEAVEEAIKLRKRALKEEKNYRTPARHRKPPECELFEFVANRVPEALWSPKLLKLMCVNDEERMLMDYIHRAYKAICDKK
eukprot:PhF_6_TR8706/c1_g1_i1/m.13646